MLIHLKNKDTLIINDFKIKCCIGKKGITRHKFEGDKSTPKGIFNIRRFYYRKDRIKKPISNLKSKIIKKNMTWCNDPKHKFYNKEIKIKKSVHYEKLFRRDHKYDYLLVIDYNTIKTIPYKGSAIFIHLTKNYKPTAGCIAINKKDFDVLLKLINYKTKIKIS